MFEFDKMKEGYLVTKGLAGFKCKAENVPPRLKSVDFLRGIAIILMILDHVRLFLHYSGFEPLNLEKTTATLFFTRWVTHFAAPIFFLTAGIAARLYIARGRTKVQLARFLLLRGIWLILLEMTVLRIVWLGINFDYHHTVVQVLWALGWSMIILAGLVFLPTSIIIICGILMIAAHNLLDHIFVTNSGISHCLWSILHVPGECEYAPGFTVSIWYPIVPWMGVIAVGYGVGALLTLPVKQQRKWLMRLGIFLIAAFVIIRAYNGYGDPQPWSAQRDGFFTLLSFLNTEKYPASLLFLLMTLGPALCILSRCGRDMTVINRPFIVFGEVPLFVYLAHLLLIKLCVVFICHGWHTFDHIVDRFHVALSGSATAPIHVDFHGYNLAVVYLLWFCTVAILFPFCRWFRDIKRQRRSSLLRYI